MSLWQAVFFFPSVRISLNRLTRKSGSIYKGEHYVNRRFPYVTMEGKKSYCKKIQSVKQDFFFFQILKLQTDTPLRPTVFPSVCQCTSSPGCPPCFG